MTVDIEFRDHIKVTRFNAPSETDEKRIVPSGEGKTHIECPLCADDYQGPGILTQYTRGIFEGEDGEGICSRCRERLEATHVEKVTVTVRL